MCARYSYTIVFYKGDKPGPKYRPPESYKTSGESIQALCSTEFQAFTCGDDECGSTEIPSSPF